MKLSLAGLLKRIRFKLQSRRMPHTVLFEIPISTTRVWLVGLVGLISAQTLLQQLQSTHIRNLYSQNYANIREKYESHIKVDSNTPRIEFANKLGYPDMGDNVYSDELPQQDWLRVGLARYTHYYSITLLPIIYSQLFVAQLYFPRAAVVIAILFLYYRQMHISRCMSQDLSDWERIQDSELMIVTVLSVLRFMALSAGLWVMISSFPRLVAISQSALNYGKNLWILRKFQK